MSEAETSYERVEKARQIMREVEDSHPNEEYSHQESIGTIRQRFPQNIDFEKLVEIADTRKIRKGLELIDEMHPWKLCSSRGGSRTTFGGHNESPNYHILIRHVPEMFGVLDVAKANGATYESGFDRDSVQVESMTNWTSCPFEIIHPYLRKAAFAGALPKGFLDTVGKIMHSIEDASNIQYLEERVAQTQEGHDKRVAELSDSWNRREFIEDEERRQQAIAGVGKKLKDTKTKIEKRVAYNASVRESGRLEGLDLDHVAKSVISLYKQFAQQGVDGAFVAGWEPRMIKNTEFGLSAPVYFEIPFDELVKKMNKGAKLGVSPSTYVDLVGSFASDSRAFPFEDRASFERDFFGFFRQLRGMTDTPDGYVSNGLLAQRRERRSLPETIGYDAAKEFTLESARQGVNPKSIEKMTSQYGRGGAW